ncbi:hypothetical protein TspCOW1_24520 [Thiohalobacter sp. COW1]|uniref:Ribonucleoside-diphosphate reductase n=1 Tax=Thiohalobacter thiocyanaticus TaxID=585455 RepID=A0A1Z4VMN3_9GAMM|nr:ribonucleoside-diphosphate reductase [Thiohalobacter thiocyanaticus]BCO32349.1 hypothetical protein TspCOW1_24520 [Thiohalobacter sp. COW1]
MELASLNAQHRGKAAGNGSVMSGVPALTFIIKTLYNNKPFEKWGNRAGAMDARALVAEPDSG